MNKLLKNKLNKIIIPKIDDSMINQLVFLIKKFTKNFPNYHDNFNIEDFILDDSSHFKFVLKYKFFEVHCFKSNNYFIKDFYPLQKMNKINFSNVVKIFDFNDNYNFMITEYLKPITENSKLKSEYGSFKIIKRLIYVVLRIIFTLFIYNKQYVKKLTCNDLGVDSTGIIKINNLNNPKYIDPNNEYEIRHKLYLSFEYFMNDLISSVVSSFMANDLKIFFNRLKDDITNYRVIELTSVTLGLKKHKVRMFKSIDVEGILSYVLRQKLINF